jgi:hypothetical protein
MKNFVSALLVLLACSGVLIASDVKTYKATYDKEMGYIVVEHGMSVSKLNESYSKLLDKLSERATGAGDLDKVRAVMAEIERFTNEKTIQSAKAKDSSPDLKRAQLSYLQNMKSLKATQARRIMALVSKYDSALGRLQTSLTKQKKLDDAFAVQNERKAVASSGDVVSAKGVLLESQKAVSTIRGDSALSATKEFEAKSNPTKIKMTSLEPTSQKSLGVPASAVKDDRIPRISGKQPDDIYFAHAPSILIYDIPAGMKSVSGFACCPVNDSQDGVIFIVTIDEKTVYESAVTSGEKKVVQFSVNIPDGAQEISFIADKNKNPHGDHAYWMNVLFANTRATKALRKR